MIFNGLLFTGMKLMYLKLGNPMRYSNSLRITLVAQIGHIYRELSEHTCIALISIQRFNYR